MDFQKTLTGIPTTIPGLTVYELPVHGDNRGWFKENWQREKMLTAGLPDFGPVQNNISYNDSRGTTRGIHAEPWDKFVSVATGRIFGAWVDLRRGPTFGTVFTAEIDPSRAIFVPRGVGNAFQTLEDHTAYSYLVNDHWAADAQYTFLNLADEAAAIDWPIALEGAELSDKDRSHPRLADVTPFEPRRTLVLGAGGQLGRALAARFAGNSRFEFAQRSDIELGTTDLETVRNWRDYDTIINASAYTAVDTAETELGRSDAWRSNVSGVADLARLSLRHRLTVVHISSDYVFDGTGQAAYSEDERVNPLGVYGQTKAAGDAIIAMLPNHYILRTSWVIGDGNNFVRTMWNLAQRGVSPSVVDDQRGRLTFASDIAEAVEHLLAVRPAYGTYNISSGGPVLTWAQIAQLVYASAGRSITDVTPVSTVEYFANAAAPVAPRPAHSTLDLSKITATGYTPADGAVALNDYLSQLEIERTS
ncbi:sugar nucleotide-binding protein [Agromyces atrinae]|uniref:dTDP-4-dehydrorhamnose reductase n=1 Tax=Agromyces atrinae TaxID=592376 RepID=A0A4Q2M1V6_9MICO|nr:bifunctional dTDP-4-dehydrorhamnose 3,5-epimerase family protein/NAD(P)-dependent oxidoreductase [Agromyces atrinae]NYD68519.1 dTDP-4-dehydrorhamnose 3,5-epimerase [Agromyces atrinae]RXZ85905.1 NAD-dependent epimerase/dehydratase family protein [Agromyces atrinae]